MNLPKQSHPVIRDVSRDPIRARVGGAQWVEKAPVDPRCFENCRNLPPLEAVACWRDCLRRGY